MTCASKGRYYEVDGAVMNPRPLQKPRPPITIAALGPLMMKYAATYADTRNTMSFAEKFEDQLTETAARVAQINKHCSAIGRNADSVRFSYNMFDAGARPSGGRLKYYESPDVFVDMVRRIVDLDFSEVGLYYPMIDEQIPMFETIARDVIPELRKEFEPTDCTLSVRSDSAQYSFGMTTVLKRRDVGDSTQRDPTAVILPTRSAVTIARNAVQHGI